MEARKRSGGGAELFEGGFGRRYDAYIKQPLAARTLGWALWGLDARAMYAVMDDLRGVPDGSTVLDAPCGGGLAFRALEPERRVRYLAVDLAKQMLDRARAEAERRGLSQIEFVNADVQDLPFDDGVAGFTLTMNSLHCVPDPVGAIAELSRCTAPGGRLSGTTFVLGGPRRSEWALRRAQRGGEIGPIGTLPDLEGWLAAAGLEAIEATRSGALAIFRARRAGD
jgi:SAM-dependent methyltransferase